MTYAELADALIAKHAAEAMKGWNGLDGVYVGRYGVPLAPLFGLLGDDDFEILGLRLDDPSLVAFAYLGEGLHPAVCIGQAHQQVGWGRATVAGQDVSTIDGALWLGDRDERPVLSHLLGYAAGRDAAMDRGLLRGQAT